MKTNSSPAISVRIIPILLLLSCPFLVHGQTPTRDVDNPARQPFRIVIPRAVRTVGTAIEIAPIFQVPQGKRLVIEQITFRALAPVSGIVSGVHAAIETTLAGTTSRHWLPLSGSSTNSLSTNRCGSMQIPEHSCFSPLVSRRRPGA